MANFLVWVVWFVAAFACLASALAVVSFSQPVLLGARADREPRVARRALPAALGRVRRGGPGARLRRRGDGDVPVRDRLPRRPHATSRRGRAGRRGRSSAPCSPAARSSPRSASSSGSRPAGSCRSRSTSAASFGSPEAIGRLFLTDHLLAFEVTSIVLLVAAVGGVVLGSHARQDRRAMHGPDIQWYVVLSATALRDRRARRDAAPQPADHPALGRDHAQLGEPAPDRVLAPARRARTARSSPSR